MTLRTMYDSVNMDAIPFAAEIVAGYPHRGGDTVWNPGRFPHALIVAIDQSADGAHAADCHAADYEPGAIWGEALLRQWVTSWHQLHPQGLAAQRGWFARPVIYSDLANLPSARSALAGLAWDLWVAEWPGPGQVLEQGAIAHQYADDTRSGGDYDLSVVSDGFGAHPVPPPPTTGAQIRAGLAETAQDLVELVALAKRLP